MKLQPGRAPDTLQVMHSRAFRVALLVFEALWLTVIVPGHQRGIVRLPGENCPACEAQTAAPDCCQKQPAPVGHKPAGDPAQHCAICYFAARLCTPPVIDLSPPPLRLVASLPVPAAHARESFPILPTYDGRAPPAGPEHSA